MDASGINGSFSKSSFLSDPSTKFVSCENLIKKAKNPGKYFIHDMHLYLTKTILNIGVFCLNYEKSSYESKDCGTGKALFTVRIVGLRAISSCFLKFQNYLCNRMKIKEEKPISFLGTSY